MGGGGGGSDSGGYDAAPMQYQAKKNRQRKEEKTLVIIDELVLGEGVMVNLDDNDDTSVIIGGKGLLIYKKGDLWKEVSFERN